jgi:hypothetical protein
MQHPIHRYLINHLSAGEFIFLFVICVALLATAVFFLVRRFFPFLITAENTKFVGLFLVPLAANYALVVGFVIVTLWRELEQVDTFVTQESEFLSTMVYSARAFPAKIQHDLMLGIEEYVHALIDYEWPAMRQGYPSQVAEAALSHLYQLIQAYSPDTKVETTFYNQFVTNLNSVAQYRGRRLEYLHTTLVDVIRYLFLCGIILIVFLMSAIKVKNKKLHLMAILFVSAIFSFNLGLALVFDYPLAGSIAISSEPFTNGVLKRLAQKKEGNESESPATRNVP